MFAVLAKLGYQRIRDFNLKDVKPPSELLASPARAAGAASLLGEPRAQVLAQQRQGSWATARSLEEAEDLIEASVEGSGEWLLDRVYSIERVAFDERPEELSDLPPRRSRAEVHSIAIDEWGDGNAPGGGPGGGGSPSGGDSVPDWGTPGGRLS